MVSLFRGSNKAAQFMPNQSFFGESEVFKKFGRGFPDLTVSCVSYGPVARARRASQGICLVHGAEGDGIKRHKGVVAYDIDTIQGPKVSIESIFDCGLHASCKAEIMVAR